MAAPPTGTGIYPETEEVGESTGTLSSLSGKQIYSKEGVS
jgi:hypothetical protein